MALIIVLLGFICVSFLRKLGNNYIGAACTELSGIENGSVHLRCSNPNRGRLSAERIVALVLGLVFHLRFLLGVNAPQLVVNSFGMVDCVPNRICLIGQFLLPFLLRFGVHFVTDYAVLAP